MMRFIYRAIAIIVVVLSATACTGREWAATTKGLDIQSYISIELSGTHREYSDAYFSSNVGRYVESDHPQITLHDDGTFSFRLHRTLYNDNREELKLCFYIDRHIAGFALGQVYSLYVIDDVRADIDLYDGDGVTTYKAANGYIVFTDRSPYAGSMLFSGEFHFEGVAEDGTRARIENGKFSSCRICYGDDYGCSAY